MSEWKKYARPPNSRTLRKKLSKKMLRVMVGFPLSKFLRFFLDYAFKGKENVKGHRIHKWGCHVISRIYKEAG